MLSYILYGIYHDSTSFCLSGTKYLYLTILSFFALRYIEAADLIPCLAAIEIEIFYFKKIEFLSLTRKFNTTCYYYRYCRWKVFKIVI